MKKTRMLAILVFVLGLVCSAIAELPLGCRNVDVAAAMGGQFPPIRRTASASHEVALTREMLLGLAATSHEQGTPIEVMYSSFCTGLYLGPPVIVEPQLPESPAGGDGYMGIREVIDNGEIRDQGTCYDSLESGTGTIVDYTAPVLNFSDYGPFWHYFSNDLFGIFKAGHRPTGPVDDLCLLARGTVRIPDDLAGDWTFGVCSDDGFTLQLPGHDFISVVGGEIVHFENGAAIRFYGSRLVQDTLGMINLGPGDHPFWLTYHERHGAAALELFAAKGIHSAFDPDVFRMVGHKGVGTFGVAGFLGRLNMTATLPGAWSGGQIDSIADALDALAEGELNETNLQVKVSVVNHHDPGHGGPGMIPDDMPFPNNDAAGIANTDDDDFAVMVRGVLEIPIDGTYEIGFNSGEGAALQIYGQTWKRIMPGSNWRAVIINDQLITDALAHWSITLGEIELEAGQYVFRAIMFERDGWSFFELISHDPTDALRLVEVGGARVLNDLDSLQLVASECFPSTYSGYDDWLALGKPDCWCAPPYGSGYQCDGDVDGATETCFNYRIYGNDLCATVKNWKRKIDDPLLDPCADIDHKSETFFDYRVYGKDLATVVTNWKKEDSDLAGDCPRPE